MTSLAHSPVNDTRFQDFLKEVRELGKESAEGKDALPKLFARTLQAAVAGVITTTLDKNGKDDAHRVYDEYAKTESKKAIHEHTANGKKTNVAKIRVAVKLGELPPNKCDAIDVFERTVIKRKELVDGEIKVKGAFPAYVDMGRKQLDSDSALTDEQIEEAIRKPDAEEKTVEKALQHIEKLLNDLITGAKGVKCQEVPITNAHDLIKNYLATLTLTRETADVMAKARELGLHIVEAEFPADMGIAPQIAA